MSEPPRDYEALFQDHLPFVERAVAAVAQVLGLTGAEAEEFGAWARERLWRDDYAVLRKWRGESRLTTYLTTVLTNFGREFRVQRWGRWRASAAAVRLGPLAVRLEALVYRDGHALAAAGTLLRQRGETTLADLALARLLDAMPRRTRPRWADEREVSLDTLPASTHADDPLREQEDDATRQSAYAALDDAVRRLPPEEQLVVRMHYLQGRTLADVARALGVPQKPLYRVKDRALATLAGRLVAAGVTPADVRELLGGALPAPPSAADDDRGHDEGAGRGGNRAGPGPSHEACASSPSDAEAATSPSAHARGGEP